MVRRSHTLFISIIALIAMIGTGLTPANAATATTTTVSDITFLGEAQLYTGYLFGDTVVGGLSGIAYKRSAAREGGGAYDQYYAISDDRSQFAPARIYQLRIDLEDGQLSQGDVYITGQNTLLKANGEPFAALSLDPEGIALNADGTVFVTSEGDANQLINPFINQFSFASGQVSTAQQIRALPIATKYLPVAGGTSGIRNNLAFESATITPDKAYLLSATENALAQDGPSASVTNGSPSRILRYNIATGTPAGEYVYPVEKVADQPIPAGSFATNGLVELLALDDTTLLSIERSFSTGVGNRIKLYRISLAGATDVSTFDSLSAAGSYTPVQKTLLIDLDTLGITLDNIEGMTLGPILPNGQRALILVSDNNFSATQFTQFLAFGVTITPPPFTTTQNAYIKPVAAGVSVTPLLTAGDEIAQTGASARSYRFTGIPDGLGAYKATDGTVKLFVNHEFGNTSFSIPVPNEQSRDYYIPEGLLKGAYVSNITLSGDSSPGAISGDIAFTQVKEYNADTGEYIDRTLDWLYFDRPFSRFCSGYLAGPHSGFSDYIYLAGEETDPATSFDGLGGIGVAIVDGIAYTLPELGHFAKENVVVVPGTGNKTVVFATEDGAGIESQLYMYVGTKNPSADNPIKRAGLVGGDLYVFSSKDASRNNEASVHKGDGTIAGKWIMVQDTLAPGEQVWNISDSILNERIKAAGAYGFVRIEDLTYDRNLPGTVYFATTGSTLTINGALANKLGRISRVTFDPTNPTGGAASLTVLLEGDAGDPIVNPDNIDINKNGILAINEDPNGENRGAGLLDSRGRDSSVWAYDVPGDGKGSDGTLVRIAEIDQTAIPNLPGYRAERGNWETSGILDVSDIYGPGAWLVVVQAHSLNSSEASALAGSSTDLKLVEGGQLLLLRTQ